MNLPFQTLKYKTDDIELDVNYSPEKGTAWLNQKQIAALFDRDRRTISWHIKNILLSSLETEHLYTNKLCTTVDRYANKLGTTKEIIGTSTGRATKYYCLEIVLEIGRRINSNKGLLLKQFLDDYLKQEVVDNKQDIIIYNNGNVKLDVKISPEEDTVWLNQAQIAELFETTVPNVSMHINNIYETGELEVFPTYKDFLIVQLEGGRKVTRKVAYYNLDMIISLGYRVNTSRGIEFRRWATSVLKRYLYKGYVIDEERVALTKSVANLEDEVQRIKNEIEEIKEKTFVEPIKEKLFCNGEYFEPRVFLNSLFEKATKSIIIIDPYFDIVGLSYLRDIPKTVYIKVVRSSRGKLHKEDLRAFRRQYRDLFVAIDETFHDRFLILDKSECYLIGTSTNGLGKRTSAIIKIDAKAIVDTLLELVKEKRP